MKMLIENSSGAVRKIIGQALKGADETIIRATGNDETLSRMLRRHRNKILNPQPYRYTDLNLSLVLSLSHSSEEFYQYGKQNYKNLMENDDILIFYTESAIEKTKN
jgi:hypothetical protein